MAGQIGRGAQTAEATGRSTRMSHDASLENAGGFAQAFIDLIGGNRTTEDKPWTYDEQRSLNVTVEGEPFIKVDSDGQRLGIITEIAPETEEWSRAIAAHGIQTSAFNPVMPMPIPPETDDF